MKYGTVIYSNSHNYGDDIQTIAASRLLPKIDYYLDRLDGYVRVEVEFDNDDDMFSFTPPEWFGDEITEINHIIHENLGIVTFDEMKERYHERKIILDKILQNN